MVVGPHAVMGREALGTAKGDEVNEDGREGEPGGGVHRLKTGVLSAYRSLRWPRFRGPGFLGCFEC